MSPSVSIRLLLTQSDKRLVEFAQAGHERAFEALVQRYRRPLLGYCRRLLLSEERAEDALQQALLQAWLAIRSGTEVGEIRPWLYRIVHNTALNALRVSGYDYSTLSESLSGADAPQEDLDRRIAVREALAGLAALPEMQREALLRTAVEGGTHQQVARDLGLSEPALRGLVYRARTTLRAATGAIVPPPLLSWALGAGARGTPIVERLAEVGAGGGSAGVAGLLMKGGAMAVTASVLAGGIAAVHVHPGAAERYSRSHSARHATQHAGGSAVGIADASVAEIAPRSHQRPGSATKPMPTHLSKARHSPSGHEPNVSMPFTTKIPLPVSPEPADTHGNGRQQGHGGDSREGDGGQNGGSGASQSGSVTRGGDEGQGKDAHSQAGDGQQGSGGSDSGSRQGPDGGSGQNSDSSGEGKSSDEAQSGSSGASGTSQESNGAAAPDRHGESQDGQASPSASSSSSSSSSEGGSLLDTSGSSKEEPSSTTDGK